MVKEEVDEDDIADVVGSWTGIPVSRLLEGETEKLIHMEERLHRRVIGQHAAVEAVSNALRRARSGLQDPDRPIGSFVFLGPTGVGKTELARALAEFMFDDERAMIRIDMSEYQERHTVSRLVGAPPGYVGYDEGGQLTEAVRRRPYSVVLLDEIEKAHSEVFDVLLQVLDDGRLTDGQGRTVDFRNTVLIMTSNIRSAEQLRDHFRPEFLNRIDEIVVFDALGKEQLADIAELQLERLRARLAERKLSLELTDAAKEVLAEAGWDPTYGARPLKRALQRLVENPLAQRLLEGEFAEGDTIRVDAQNGELVFERAPEPSPSDGVAQGQRPGPGSPGSPCSHSERGGAKRSSTVAPSGPASARCGVFEGISQVSPGPSSRSSSPTRKRIEPRRTSPSCSWSWLCSSATAPGSSSTTASVSRSPWTARARDPVPDAPRDDRADVVERAQSIRSRNVASPRSGGAPTMKRCSSSSCRFESCSAVPGWTTSTLPFASSCRSGSSPSPMWIVSVPPTTTKTSSCTGSMWRRPTAPGG